MVIWCNMRFLSSPRLFRFNGQADFETLKAISLFIKGTAFDQSGVLSWPFPTTLKLDQSGVVPVLPVAECFDARAQAIWAESSAPVMVLCGGDIDSVAVLAALLKYAPSPSSVVVHYTSASLARYPKLFSEILPALGVLTVDRTGVDLVGDTPMRYCDGRSGDDFQAAYREQGLQRIAVDIKEGTVAEAIEYIAGGLNSRPEHQALAVAGLTRWVAGQPYAIETPWQLTLALYRTCFTQSSAWAGIMLEQDTVAAYTQRVPFYDSVAFSSATRWFAENTDWPTDDYAPVKDYTYAFFQDHDWFTAPKVQDIHTVVSPGRLATCWLNDGGSAWGFPSFPA